MPDNYQSYGVVDPIEPNAFSEVGTKANSTGNAHRKGLEAAPLNESIAQGAPNPDWLDSFTASFQENTLTGKLLNPFAWDDVHHNRDTSYNAEGDIANIRSNLGVTLNEEQEAFLRKSVSKEDFLARVQEWTKHEENVRTAGMHTSALLLGGLVDPVDAVAGAGLGKIASAARLGVAARAGLGFGAGYAMSVAPESTNTNSDNLWNAVGPMIGTMIPTGKNFKADADALAAERKALNAPADMAIEEARELKKSSLPDANNKAPVASYGQAIAGGIKKMQSLVDEVSAIGPKAKALAEKVLGRPWDDASAANAGMAWQRNFMMDAQRSIAEVEEVMKQEGLFTKSWLPGRRAAARERRIQVGQQVQEFLHMDFNATRNGGQSIPLDVIKDPTVRKVVETIQNSGWAENLLRRAKDAAVDGAIGIQSSKSYMPIVWDYKRIRDFMHRTGTSLDDVATAFGQQITKTLGHFAHSDAKNIGMQFLKTIQGEKTGDLHLKYHDWEAFGLSKEELVATLRMSGHPEADVVRAVDQLFGSPNLNSVGDVTKSLRHRLEWDLTKDFQGEGFVPFRLSDFVESDIHKLMDRNTLEMTSRIGLAKAGYRSGGEFQKALDEAADEAFKAGKSESEVRVVLDHLREMALGRPTGEQVDEWVRSMSSMGSAIVLGSSGIYNIGDYATLAYRMGLKDTVAAFIPALRKSSIATMTRKEGELLSDVISGRMIADGRFRPVVSYLEDNFENSLDGIHESVSYATQSVRFLNFSEQIRRHQSKMFASIYENRLEQMLKGDSKARKYFADSGVSSSTIERMTEQYSKHGMDIEKWPPNLVDEISTHALSEAEGSVLAIRKGEKPRLMDSQLGKAILPFMSFVFAAHNKVLRRNFHKDGVAGVAMMLAYQAPLAVIAASAANVAKGKPWDEKLEQNIPKAMSGIGLYSMPWDLITRGRMGGAFPGFAPVNSAAHLLSGPSSLKDAQQNIPFVSVFAPLSLAMGAISDINQDKKGK